MPTRARRPLRRSRNAPGASSPTETGGGTGRIGAPVDWDGTPPLTARQIESATLRGLSKTERAKVKSLASEISEFLKGTWKYITPPGGQRKKGGAK